MRAFSLLLGAACTAAPAPVVPPVTAAGCPPGMVAVSGGSGVLGMKGQPYGIVATAHLEKVEAPERGCAAAVAGTPGALTCWVQTNLVDPVVGLHPVTVAPFCIESHPFPGPGAAYTRDGMTAWDAARLQALLGTGRYGPRRLCTFSELEAAVAGLGANQRFVYGDAPDPARCPDRSPIGADPACRNPETGVFEYGAVNSHWVVADADFVAAACPSPPCAAAGGHPLRAGMLIVAGGTARAQTRQAPLTPHTWHDHGEPNPTGCDQMGWDDQPVICADPDPRYVTGPVPPALVETEAAWATLVALARQTGSMTATLEAGLGEEVCDEEVPPPM